MNIKKIGRAIVRPFLRGLVEVCLFYSYVGTMWYTVPRGLNLWGLNLPEFSLHQVGSLTQGTFWFVAMSVGSIEISLLLYHLVLKRWWGLTIEANPTEPMPREILDRLKHTDFPASLDLHLRMCVKGRPEFQWLVVHNFLTRVRLRYDGFGCFTGSGICGSHNFRQSFLRCLKTTEVCDGMHVEVKVEYPPDRDPEVYLQVSDLVEAQWFIKGSGLFDNSRTPILMMAVTTEKGNDHNGEDDFSRLTESFVVHRYRILPDDEMVLLVVEHYEMKCVDMGSVLPEYQCFHLSGDSVVGVRRLGTYRGYADTYEVDSWLTVVQRINGYISREAEERKLMVPGYSELTTRLDKLSLCDDDLLIVEIGGPLCHQEKLHVVEVLTDFFKENRLETRAICVPDGCAKFTTVKKTEFGGSEG